MAEKRPNRMHGPGHDDFWAWCDKGELRLQGCENCGRLAWPVVKACEFCGHAEFAWQPLSGRAKLVSWCVFERDYNRGLLPIPWPTILVELDEGALFVSNPVDLSLEDFELDLPLKVRFLDCEDDGGAFRLPVFERA